MTKVAEVDSDLHADSLPGRAEYDLAVGSDCAPSPAPPRAPASCTQTIHQRFINVGKVRTRKLARRPPDSAAFLIPGGACPTLAVEDLEDPSPTPLLLQLTAQ